MSDAEYEYKIEEREKRKKLISVSAVALAACFFIGLLLLSNVAQVVAAEQKYLVKTGANSLAISSYSSQRNVALVNGWYVYFWIDNASRNNVYTRTSQDGETWSNEQLSPLQGSETLLAGGMDVDCDGYDYVFVGVESIPPSIPGTIHYYWARGLVNDDGSITWDARRTVYTSGAGAYDAHYVAVGWNAEDKMCWFASGMDWNVANYYLHIYSSSNNGSSWDWRLQTWSGGNNYMNARYVNIICLSSDSDDMWFFAADWDNGGIHYWKWDGSAFELEDGIVDRYRALTNMMLPDHLKFNEFSAVIDINNIVWFSYVRLGGQSLYQTVYTTGNNTWGAESQVDTATATYAFYPSIGSDTDVDKLHVYAKDGVLYSRKFLSTGSFEAAEATWGNSFSTPIQCHVNKQFEVPRFHVSWQESGASTPEFYLGFRGPQLTTISTSLETYTTTTSSLTSTTLLTTKSQTDTTTTTTSETLLSTLSQTDTTTTTTTSTSPYTSTLFETVTTTTTSMVSSSIRTLTATTVSPTQTATSYWVKIYDKRKTTGTVTDIGTTTKWVPTTLVVTTSYTTTSEIWWQNPETQTVPTTQTFYSSFQTTTTGTKIFTVTWGGGGVATSHTLQTDTWLFYSTVTSKTTTSSTTSSTVTMTQTNPTKTSTLQSTIESTVVLTTTSPSTTQKTLTSEITSSFTTTSPSTTILTTSLSTVESTITDTKEIWIVQDTVTTTTTTATSVSTLIDSTVTLTSTSLETSLMTSTLQTTSISTSLTTTTLEEISTSTSLTTTEETSVETSLTTTTLEETSISTSLTTTTLPVTSVSTSLTTSTLETTSVEISLTTTTLEETSVSTSLTTTSLTSVSTSLTTTTLEETSIETSLTTTTLETTSISTSLTTTTLEETSVSTSITETSLTLTSVSTEQTTTSTTTLSVETSVSTSLTTTTLEETSVSTSFTTDATTETELETSTTTTGTLTSTLTEWITTTVKFLVRPTGGSLFPIGLILGFGFFFLVFFGYRVIANGRATQRTSTLMTNTGKS